MAVTEVDAYSELGKNFRLMLRWRGNLLWGFLVMFSALMIATYALVTSGNGMFMGVAWIIPVGGILLTLAFYFGDKRCHDVILDIYNLGCSLEKRGDCEGYYGTAEKRGMVRLTHTLLLKSVYFGGMVIYILLSSVLVFSALMPNPSEGARTAINKSVTGGGGAMAKQDAEQTVEQQRDSLFKEGTKLLSDILESLRMTQTIRVTPLEATLRNAIVKQEHAWLELMKLFAEYNQSLSSFLERIATASSIRSPEGVKPIRLNERIQFAIYISELSAHRETIRSAMNDLSGQLSSLRSQANSQVALVVALASLLVAIFLGIVNLFSR